MKEITMKEITYVLQGILIAIVFGFFCVGIYASAAYLAEHVTVCGR